MMPRCIHTNIHTYLRTKYILKCVPESNSLGPIFIQKFFLGGWGWGWGWGWGHFSLYTSMESGVARRDPALVTPEVNLCTHTMFQVCRSKGLYGQNNIFGFFEA